MASLYDFMISSLTVKSSIVLQLGHTEIGCLMINSNVKPSGVLHIGQGNAIILKIMGIFVITKYCKQQKGQLRPLCRDVGTLLSF